MKYIIECIIFVSYFLYALSLESGNLYMKDIMIKFNIDSIATGSHVANANSLAKVIGSFMAGWFLIRLRDIRLAFLFSSFLIFIGSLFVPMVNHFEMIIFFRFVMGFGGALMLAYISGIVFEWFSHRERPIINGINGIAYSLGATVGIFIAWDLLDFFGTWEKSLYFLSFLSFVFFIYAFFIFIKKRNNYFEKSKQDVGDMYSYKEAFTQTQVVLFGVGQAGVLSFYICFLVYLPSYFRDIIEVPNDSIVRSVPKIISLIGIISSIIGGIVSKYYTNRLMIIRICSFLQIIFISIILFSINETLIFISSILVGVTVFFPISSFISYAQEWHGMTPKRLGVVFGLFWAVAYGIATIVPWVFGKLIDISGEYIYSFIFIICVDSLYFLTSLFLKDNNKSV